MEKKKRKTRALADFYTRLESVISSHFCRSATAHSGKVAYSALPVTSIQAFIRLWNFAFLLTMALCYSFTPEHCLDSSTHNICVVYYILQHCLLVADKAFTWQQADPHSVFCQACAQSVLACRRPLRPINTSANVRSNDPGVLPCNVRNIFSGKHCTWA